MSTVLNSSLKLDLTVKVLVTDTDGTWLDRYQPGAGSLTDFQTVLTDGSGSYKATKHYHKAVTVPTASFIDLDLNAIVSPRQGTLDFASVKQIVLRLRSPATGVKVVVGNAGTTPWAPWLSSATATEDLFDLIVKTCPIDAWTVPATGMGTGAILRLATAAGTDQTVDVSIVGN